MELISFTKDEKYITIKIPIPLLKFAAENKPEWGMIVHNEHELAEKVVYEFENGLGSMGSGLTGFQELTDKAIERVADNGEECIEFKSFI